MADMSESEVVLTPGEYAYVSDQNNGTISTGVGPCKINLQGTDKPLKYDPVSRLFLRVNSIREAIQKCIAVDERSYAILHNPSQYIQDPHPKPNAKNIQASLENGKMINLQGPCTFALWPGQMAEVIQGHQLRSNEYLVVEVYNVTEALKSYENEVDRKVLDQPAIVTGQLLIIKGTEQSFYIPPTGFRVVKDTETNKYVRSAVTLECLEYCILLDESGDKRYVRGPAVVFPEPTEEFVDAEGGQQKSRKYRAIELNDQMGIHVKVITEYEGVLAGTELHITGATQKIYYPRAEHAIIKYGDKDRQYAIAIPSGEGRYVLEKRIGDVKTVKGPRMYLPNPIEEVIVRRVLTPKQVKLWFPNSPDALEHNKRLAEIANDSSQAMTYVSDDQVRMRGAARSMTKSFGQAGEALMNEMQRGNTFSPPRTITLDTKYDGAVYINVWPGYAVQVVSRSGERRVVQGPEGILLEYDETLEVLSLSRGRPKTSEDLIETPYLRVSNNRVSDMVDAETKDMVPVKILVYYRVNFEGDPNLWFSTENYVQFMADHLRSLIRNAIKKIGIEELTDNAADIIRDTVLGKSEDGKRTGRVFQENGMRVYDIEILKVSIDNPSIAKLLLDTQQHTVAKALEAVQKAKTLEVTQRLSEIDKQLLEAQYSVKLKGLDLSQKESVRRSEIALEDLKATEATQTTEDTIHSAKLNRQKNSEDLRLNVSKIVVDQEILAFKEKMAALQPGLIEAINNAAKMSLMTELTTHLPQATGGLGLLLGKGGMEGIMKMVQGNPILEDALKGLQR
jgi:major vault protein